MNADEAISKMVSPSERRNKRNGGVMQIHITRACDKACFNCTQGSNLRGPYQPMTPQQFEFALMSLRDYPYTIGIFGGNPATHPQFELLCDILLHYFPQEQCGVWCNNPLGKGATMRKTFNPARSNLNCHMDLKAYEEFKQDWPESMPFGHKDDSRHSPVFVAMIDLDELKDDEEKRWELISKCEINRYWSASIGVFRGELRGWFCEIAMAQSILHQHDPSYPDTGMYVTIPSGFSHLVLHNSVEVPGVSINTNWWKRPIQDYSHQIKKHCHECGVPLKGYGTLACADDETGVEHTSPTHAVVYRPKHRNRKVALINSVKQLASKGLSFIQYLQGANK